MPENDDRYPSDRVPFQSSNILNVCLSITTVFSLLNITSYMLRYLSPIIIRKLLRFIDFSFSCKLEPANIDRIDVEGIMISILIV